MPFNEVFWLNRMEFATLTLGTRFFGGLIATGFFALLWFVKKRKNSGSISPTKNYPEDTVLLHQMDRGPYAPSISPFAIKLETYLRICNIPYKNIHDNKRGSKGKIPWIEYNGQVVPDTQFIMEYLNKLRQVDLNKRLTPEQKSSARAVQRMVDEHTYWILIYYRWVVDKDKKVMKLAKWSNFKIWIISKIARIQTYIHGIGRHSQQEVLHILDNDLQALSQYLGDKKYFMGDQPCEVDCSIFGQLSQFRWHLPDTNAPQLITGDKKYFMGDQPCEVDCSIFGQLSQFRWHLPDTNAPQLITEKYTNLDRYLERMKTTYWEDWENCVAYG